MHNADTISRPSVLVLSPDAEAYFPVLETLVSEGVELAAATSPHAARKVYSGQPVILGQPDLVAEVLADMPEVAWVQSSWAGVTPLLDAGRSDYQLTGVKDTFGPQMTEYVLAYLLAHELKLFERLGRQANRSWWAQPSGTLKGKTIGIMGTGSIGSHIARLVGLFGARIIGFSLSGAPVEGFDRVFAGDRLADFLADPDYIVCVLPDTPGTRHLLDAEAFKLMKSHALLVNIGRGTVVDEAALVQALEAGELAGAVLDVFQQEPLPPDSPLWHSPGAILTGHVAARSLPQDIAGIFIENYRRYCAGERLRYRIDFDRGY
ncbi:MAG: D-2-hydroxyacid dehydrogenase [Xanthomonadales bacterium]|nr:D-2-hydroxyacid dehydrogenase [Gammaproteobacteria bacterium]MBT8055048.1 D-2-hydroxyacid dehydrogenase [Gammaproteobacteria bacterium]NND58095.1 D-2-hydroxyacid dehydrogenase [Xanthomonadales bacterium]NNK51754.1 D-2-hydroxyacid dehydrogenase [Xanthomonadales bacterium]